jgi:hypothetical protein
VNFAKPVEGGGFEKKVVWDLEAERLVVPKLTMFFEVYSAEEGVKTASVAAEYQYSPRVNFFGVLARNEEHANIFRAGFNVAMDFGN